MLDNRNSTVLLERWRNGNFATENIRDPFNNNAPFASGVIPASRISPVAQKFQERFYPLPNFGNTAIFGNPNYRTQSTRAFDPNTYWTMRFGHRFSQKHFVFGRYIWNRSHSRGYDNSLPAFGQRWQTRDTRGVNTSYTATISSTMVNEARWGYAWNDNPRHGPLMGQEVLRSLGIAGDLAPGVPDLPGVLQVAFTGLAITATSQTPWRHPGFLNFAQQFQDQLSWFHGKHNIKMGVLGGRTLYQDQNMPAALFGNLNFSTRYSNHAYADFLLGIPTSAQRAAPALFQERTRWDWNFFVTDEWKVRPNLTLNLGLRYEIHPPWEESTGRQSMFDVATGRIVIPNGATSLVSPLMPRGYVEIVEASAAGFPDKTLIRADRNNFAPRIGLDWRPLGNNTVIRAGFGIFSDVVPRQVNAGGSPFVVDEPTFTNELPNPTLFLPRIFPNSVAGPATVTLPAGNRLDLRDPYSMQYNFTIEHQRWATGFRASYIGTNTRQGQWGYNYNQPLPSTTPFVDNARPFPRYPGITYQTNGAGHQYHSLTLEAERRWTNGLAYQASWVWARDIGDLERGESPENAFDRA